MVDGFFTEVGAVAVWFRHAIHDIVGRHGGIAEQRKRMSAQVVDQVLPVAFG